jgi:hypothetical protein
LRSHLPNFRLVSLNCAGHALLPTVRSDLSKERLVSLVLLAGVSVVRPFRGLCAKIGGVILAMFLSIISNSRNWSMHIDIVHQKQYQVVACMPSSSLWYMVGINLKRQVGAPVVRTFH